MNSHYPDLHKELAKTVAKHFKDSLKLVSQPIPKDPAKARERVMELNRMEELTKMYTKMMQDQMVEENAEEESRRKRTEDLMVRMKASIRRVQSAPLSFQTPEPVVKSPDHV